MDTGRDAVLLAAEQQALLEQIARDAPLEQILDGMATAIEHLLPGALVSVLVADTDGMHLRHGAAPSLPVFYNQAIDGIATGEGVGSCGTAAHRRLPVIVADITSHPFWDDFRDLAGRAGLAACWSTPILAADGTLLGTFAVYYRVPRNPRDGDIALNSMFARIAALAIERHRIHQARRTAEAKERRAFDHLTQLAHDLQAGLLLRELPVLPGARVAAFYEAAGAGLDIGGDFYDVFPLPGDRWAFMIGDVCGRGALAAANTGLVRHTARAVARLVDEPTAVVEAVNAALLDRSPQQDTGFVTMVYGQFRRCGDHLEVDLVRAGHLPPLLRLADHSVEEVSIPGAYLGMRSRLGLTARHLTLHRDDSLVLVTDGITEARSPSGELFSERRLADVLAAARPPAITPTLLMDTLVSAVARFAADARYSTDDSAALILTAS